MKENISTNIKTKQHFAELPAHFSVHTLDMQNTGKFSGNSERNVLLFGAYDKWSAMPYHQCTSSCPLEASKVSRNIKKLPEFAKVC